MRIWWLVLFVAFSNVASAQMSDDDVEGLKISDLPNGRVKLTWDAESSVPCVYGVTYSVFRSGMDQFEPDVSNRVMAGIKTNSVILLDTTKESYYHVRSVHTPIICRPSKPEPGYHETLTIHPITSDNSGLFMSLRTKWRAGTNQKGELSYIVKGFHLGAGDDAAYYAQARRCSFTLELQDSQGFKIRDIALDFVAVTGTGGVISALEANDLATLPNEQYREFAQGGGWNLAWACPK